jgi:hypothetical protein
MGADPAAAFLRDRFLNWQCRLRKKAVREQGGRPSPGMRPRVLLLDGRELAPAVTVLLIERDAQASTDQFRHIVRKTNDPRERYAAGLRVLSASHYQDPSTFGDVLTALFSAESAAARELLGAARCVLEFEEGAQGFGVPCAVAELAEGEAAWEATYWHNHLFNPEPPNRVRILAFVPDWGAAEA